MLSRASLVPRIFRGYFFLTVYLRSRYTDEVKEGLLVVYKCMSQVYVNLQRFYDAPTMSIYRNFMVLRLCQFTEILWCPDYVNLQRFYGTPTMSIYRDFMVPRLCQFTKILQRFYGAPTMSIYRDFIVPQVCQFTEILHDQTKRVKSLQMLNLQTFLEDFVKSINYESYPLILAAVIYKHLTTKN